VRIGEITGVLSSHGNIPEISFAETVFRSRREQGRLAA
jgi:hypothetical protein